MSLRFKKRILAHLQDRRYEPVGLDELVEQIGLEPAHEQEFEQAVKELEKQGALTRDKQGAFELPAIGDEVVGEIRVNVRGFGFVIPDEPNREGDLFVPASGIGSAVNRDRVRAAVRRSQRRGGGKPGDSEFVGEVVEIIERGRSEFVGTLKKIGSHFVVEPEDRQLHSMIKVRDVGAKNAKVGDKVVVEMLSFPEDGQWGEGVITERLGEAGKPSVETMAVIRSYDLPGEFEDSVLDDARKAARQIDDIERLVKDGEREDLRDVYTLTIDPPDAKDFDDAISLRATKGGGFELGVHIADVSHYIPVGSALDEEAKERGNSVYLPRLVIPMLPEVLSNGVCSLQEGVDRLTKSAFVTYDKDGNVTAERYSATVINSNKRLTYLEAEHLLKGDAAGARQHAMNDTPHTDELLEHLHRMDDLAKRLRARRIKDGMIVLTLPDAELIFDDDGNVIGAQPEDDASTHGLIEMFMVEANEAVARLFDRLKLPILRRTHPDPSTFDLGELRQYVRVAGLNLPKNATRFELQAILAATKGTPRQQAIHFAILKSLTKAEYSPALIGHFALASAHYAHFTSPIRRYPDLILHRQLSAFLEETRNGLERPKGSGRKKLAARLRNDARFPDEDRLISMGRHCNDTERNAEMAERSLRTFLVLQFLERHHQGDVLEGVVTSVSESSMFVQIATYLVEGFVNVRDAESFQWSAKGRGGGGARAERWKLNSRTGAIQAGESGLSITIGDRLRVRLTAIDPANRRMDLQVVGKVGSDKKSAKTNATPADDDRSGKNRKPSKKKSERRAKSSNDRAKSKPKGGSKKRVTSGKGKKRKASGGNK